MRFEDHEVCGGRQNRFTNAEACGSIVGPGHRYEKLGPSGKCSECETAYSNGRIYN